jgi:hypothetical protein
MDTSDIEVVPLWALKSESGRSTECHLRPTATGDHEVLIVHGGTVAATELYESETQARTRAWALNAALRAHGWSPPE